LLKKDTGLDNVSEIRTVMEDRDDWRERARRTCSSTGLMQCKSNVIEILKLHRKLVFVKTT